MLFEIRGNRIAAIGWCQPDRLHLRAFAFLLVLCVEGLQSKNKAKGFTTEDAEKNERGHAELLPMRGMGNLSSGQSELFVSLGVENHEN